MVLVLSARRDKSLLSNLEVTRMSAGCSVRLIRH